MRAEKIIETQNVVGTSLVTQAVDEIRAEYDILEGKFLTVQEQLVGMNIMLDNTGWSEIYGTNTENGGPTIDQVKNASYQLRALTAQNAHLKRGNLLRTNYVWDGGIHYEGVPGAGRGRGTNVQALIDDPINQREFFGSAARKKRSKSLYTDGHVIYMGDDATKKLKAIDFQRITGILTDPMDVSEVWAFRVTTQRNSNVPNMAGALSSQWVFLDGYTDMAKVSSLPQSSDPIAKGKRLFVRYANPTTGWTWGTPDALAAMAWVRLYREFLLSGKKMSDSMAMLWAQVKSDTKNGAAAAAVQFSTGNAGGTAFGGPEVSPLSTAGKGYDFDSGRALLAAAATSLEVSVVALASDPGAAGSSYGSAQTLDLPGRMAIAAIREDEAEFDEQILRWMGASAVNAWFDTLLDGDQLYREAQAIVLGWSQGVYSPDEFRSKFEALNGNTVPQKAVDGAMIPNNTRFAGTLSNDTPPAGGAPTGGTTGSVSTAAKAKTSTAAPDQGVSNKAGSGTGSNDIRTDKVS